MTSEDMVPVPDNQQSIQVIQDDQEIMVLGDDSAVDAWLKSEGLDKEPTQKLNNHALQACGTGIQALADASQQSGRWVKLTKESAEQMKKYGSTGTGVLRKEHGQIAYHLKFKDLTKVSSKVNPEMLANVGGVMTQMALQQSMDEITDYLAEIDRKIDNLLQDQKDQVIADLVGTANMIDETMTIRDKVGMVTDTTWSKVADCPKDLASAQSYALIKMKNLATDLSKKKDVKDSEKLTDTLLKEVTDWSAVIANSINEQDKLYVIELDRVMVEYPQEVSQYREGINAARRKRLHDIANEITLLSKNIQDSAQIIREQKVWSPRKVTKALKSLKETNDLLSEFAVKIGVDTDFVEIEMAPHWKDAAGKLIADTTVEIGEGAKQIGSGAVKFGKGAGQKLGEGAELVGDYAGQLGESIKENQNKLAEKLASERAKETQKPKTGKAESRPKLHDLLLKYKDSKE